jgi:hypothetical protein
MIGEKAVRTSARFIWLAAESSPCRITSVVTGSASTAPLDAPTPARVTTTSFIVRPPRSPVRRRHGRPPLRPTLCLARRQRTSC